MASTKLVCLFYFYCILNRPLCDGNPTYLTAERVDIQQVSSCFFLGKCHPLIHSLFSDDTQKKTWHKKQGEGRNNEGGLSLRGPILRSRASGREKHVYPEGTLHIQYLVVFQCHKKQTPLVERGNCHNSPHYIPLLCLKGEKSRWPPGIYSFTSKRQDSFTFQIAWAKHHQ